MTYARQNRQASGQQDRVECSQNLEHGRRSFSINRRAADSPRDFDSRTAAAALSYEAPLELSSRFTGYGRDADSRTNASPRLAQQVPRERRVRARPPDSVRPAPSPRDKGPRERRTATTSVGVDLRRRLDSGHPSRSAETPAHREVTAPATAARRLLLDEGTVGEIHERQISGANESRCSYGDRPQSTCFRPTWTERSDWSQPLDYTAVSQHKVTLGVVRYRPYDDRPNVFGGQAGAPTSLGPGTVTSKRSVPSVETLTSLSGPMLSRDPP